MVQEIIIEAANQILSDLACEETRPGAIVAPDRYLPMPYGDFAALSRLTAPESVSQFKAVVVSALALLKFKKNSSHWPEQFPWACSSYIKSKLDFYIE